ncbi:MAG: ABC transporter permease [Tepidisphaeraceae bacterium]
MTGVLSRYNRELSVAGVYAALLVLMAALAPAFFSDEFANTWTRAAPTLVAAVGMTFVIVARHIDISIGSQFSICGVMAGLLAKAGLPVPAVAVVTIAMGCVMGSLNGVLVAFAGLPSIVVTLATMVIGREALRWARQGDAVRDLPAGFQWFGFEQSTGEWMLVVVAALVTLTFAWIARNLAGGRAIFAVGSDAAAARLAGIRPRLVTFSTFVLLGGLVGLAAVMNAVRFAQVDTNAGVGMELAVIAAVVVGGTAINGGRGTLLGTVVGVALLTTIGPALTFLKIPSQWERAVQGVIILAAVASDRLFSGKGGAR